MKRTRPCYDCGTAISKRRIRCFTCGLVPGLLYLLRMGKDLSGIAGVILTLYVLHYVYALAHGVR